MKIRTFIAIELSDSVRQNIAELQQELKRDREKISWTKPENIHLTLKFLGDTDETKLDDIANIITDIAGDYQSFNVSVSGLGVFPNFRRPRVLWIGIPNPASALIEIAEKIDTRLAEIGFKKDDRKFSPHLTIGRVKTQLSDRFIEKLKSRAVEAGEFTVHEILIIKSDLHPKGAIYTPLRKIALMVVK